MGSFSSSRRHQEISEVGIGRREFLKFVGTGLTALASTASPAATSIGDLYINRKLGIAFRKPTGWHFDDLREMGLIKAGQLLDLDDSDAARDLVQSVELPLVTISQVPLSATSRVFTP